MQRRLAARCLVVYLFVLFLLTLGMFHRPHRSWNLEPFRSIRHDLREGGVEFVVNFLGNLAAFVPMGWLLPSLLSRRWLALKIAGLSFAVSLFIEVLQGISGRRVADVDDLILNTISGLLGYGCWMVAEWFATATNRGDRRA